MLEKFLLRERVKDIEEDLKRKGLPRKDRRVRAWVMARDQIRSENAQQRHEESLIPK